MSAINPREQGRIIEERLVRYLQMTRTVATDDQMRQGYLVFKLTKVLPRAIKALQRISAGTYHSCENCGEPIGNDRLRAVPAATKCISCQKESEARR